MDSLKTNESRELDFCKQCKTSSFFIHIMGRPFSWSQRDGQLVQNSALQSCLEV